MNQAKELGVFEDELIEKNQKLEDIKNKIEDIKVNDKYKELPDWVKTNIEEVG